MALELIGAGFGRTGTMSTRTALQLLGYPCYHMTEVMADGFSGKHLKFWQQVAREPAGAQQDWESVFADYRATLDFPAACVWQELIEAYPQAKVLLTVHPGGAGAWFDSVWETIYFTERDWQFKLLRLLPPFRRFSDMSRDLIWGRSLKGTMPDRVKAMAAYDAHVEAVRAAVPADRLLVFDVKDGWAPLCAFLNVPIPEEPFPRINERAQLKSMIGLQRMIVNAVLVLIAGLVGFALSQ